MTGLNHALTGITIAIVVKRPELALPLAFLSHFILDMTPHSLMDIASKKTFRGYLIVEAVSMVTVTVVAMLLFPDQWFLIGLCAMLAFLPDMLWPFYHNGSLREKRFFRPFYLFHQKIQWSETKRGFVFEGLYGAVLVIFLLSSGAHPII